MDSRAQMSGHPKCVAVGTRIAVRKCLGGCGQEFLSEGPWKRICPMCTKARSERASEHSPTARVASGLLGRHWLEDE